MAEGQPPPPGDLAPPRQLFPATSDGVARWKVGEGGE